MAKNGFTLVELIIALAVGMVIMLAVYAGLNMAQRTSGSTDRKVVTQQDTRAVLDLMAMEIRMASYNPTNVNTTWGTIPACAQMGLGTPTIALKGIQLANRNTIVVAMDLNGSGGIGDVSNEYLMYSYNGADTITRNVSCGGNDAILGGAGKGTNVRNTGNIFLFRYFNNLDQDITTAIEGDQTQIPNIRRILITIAAENEFADPGSATPRKMIYSTNIIVRNHVLSP